MFINNSVHFCVFFWSKPGRADGSEQEARRSGLRSVCGPRNLGGPSEEVPNQAEEGAGEGGEQRPRQVSFINVRAALPFTVWPEGGGVPVLSLAWRGRCCVINLQLRSQNKTEIHFRVLGLNTTFLNFQQLNIPETVGRDAHMTGNDLINDISSLCSLTNSSIQSVDLFTEAESHTADWWWRKPVRAEAAFSNMNTVRYL